MGAPYLEVSEGLAGVAADGWVLVSTTVEQRAGRTSLPRQCGTLNSLEPRGGGEPRSSSAKRGRRQALIILRLELMWVGPTPSASMCDLAEPEIPYVGGARDGLIQLPPTGIVPVRRGEALLRGRSGADVVSNEY